MRHQIAVDLPHPECDASIFQVSSHLCSAHGFYCKLARGGRRRGAERRGAVAGRNRKEAGVKKHQKTAKSEGVEEAKADKSGKIIRSRAGGGVENGGPHVAIAVAVLGQVPGL